MKKDMAKIQKENFAKIMDIFEPMVQRYLKSINLFDYYHLTLRKKPMIGVDDEPQFQTWNDYWKTEIITVPQFLFAHDFGTFTFVGDIKITYQEILLKPSYLLMYLFIRATNIWMDICDKTDEALIEKNIKLRDNIPQYVKTNYGNLDDEVFKKLSR